MNLCQDGDGQPRPEKRMAHCQLDLGAAAVRGERFRMFFFIVIMALVSLVVAGIAIYVLYQAAIEGQRERLTETAQSQARLIEAVARFDRKHDSDRSGDPAQATLDQIIDAHEHYEGFGETGEFTLARRVDDEIVFLLSHRHIGVENSMRIRSDSKLAEPMRRSLSGLSGTMTGLDYRGEVVLAAYEPVEELNLGIVAKIDLAEIRAPFLVASQLALGAAVVVTLLGSVLFVRVTNPIIRRFHELHERAQQELAERNRAETVLKESQERFDLAVCATSDGIWDWNITTDQEYYAPRWCEILGYSYNDLELPHVHDTWTSRIHPDDCERVMQAVQNHLEKGTVFDEDYRHRHKSGEYRWQNSRGKAIFGEDGKPTRMVGCIRDITEAKQVEMRLRKLSAVVEHSPVSIMITDHTGMIEYVNAKFCEVSGYDYDEVIGRHTSILRSEKMSTEFYDVVWDTITAGNEWRGEVHNRSKNGKLFWESIWISPIRNSQGVITNFVAVKEDITARKRNEKTLRQQEKQLTHVSRLSTMGEMAAGFAHELNQPLGAISNYAGNCLHLLESGDVNGVRRDLEEVVGIAHRSGEIIRRIKRFVKRQEPHRSTVIVAQLIADVVAFVGREAGLHGIAITHDTSGAPRSIIADYIQLEQVLLNLALNGIEAMMESEQGEKTLTVRAVRRGTSHVEFSVHDTGNGISHDCIECACEAFITTKPDGLGMGLAICKTIVEAHQGSLVISSEVGQGTLITVLLPLGTKDK